MNTIAPALKLLCKEGMSKESPLKIKKALKEIDRDARKYNWTDERIESLPTEWQWRVCTARLQLGYLDWRGWQFRNGRAGHDPFDFPVWKSGLPIYPLEHECKEPEKVDRLLIYSEQGIGDQIMFAQAFRWVLPYAKEIVVECEPRLADIFQRSFPEIHFHPLKDLRDGSWAKDFDAKVMMGDVVARFLRSPAKFTRGAYLSPRKDLVDKWDEWLADKPAIGLWFAGRQGYLDPEILPDGINLQYGEWEAPWISPPIDLKEDLEDVFAITSCLDKCIGVANTNVNIAGSLGVPCEVILTPGEGQVNNAINYRFGMGSEMLWHESVKIFRNLGQWKSR